MFYSALDPVSWTAWLTGSHIPGTSLVEQQPISDWNRGRPGLQPLCPPLNLAVAMSQFADVLIIETLWMHATSAQSPSAVYWNLWIRNTCLTNCLSCKTTIHCVGVFIAVQHNFPWKLDLSVIFYDYQPLSGMLNLIDVAPFSMLRIC